jgi:transcriptional regulator with XRE-family HTH domain
VKRGESALRSVETARRARAARGYGGFTYDGLAEASGVSKDNIKRTEAGKRTYDDNEKQAIAKACKVPLEVFDAPDLEVYSRLGVIEATLNQLREAAGLPEPRGQLGRRLADVPPTTQDQPDTDSDQGKDARPDSG